MGIDTKYRPKIFDDVIGQDVAVTILRSSVKNKKYSSAYLYSGPSGVGKTTIGRIFAKAVLCKSPLDGNPCGTCPSCVSFDEEKNFGYTEVDAASVGGKDDMIKLKDDAAFISIENKKILLIDECQDISNQGQDALLKQVEQCPDHLIYLFCTTEAEKIKPTLRKRCLQFQFSRVKAELIEGRLKQVCDSENIVYDEIALRTLADRSDGHVRDSLKMLEEVNYFGPVTLESISKVFVDYSNDICEILLNLGSNLAKSIELSKKLSLYISVEEFYEQMLIMVSDSVKVLYGYMDFLPKRKDLLIKLRNTHGTNLIEFMNFLISRDKFIEKIGLQSDIVLLHYKFCANGFKPVVPVITENKNTQEVVPVIPDEVQNESDQPTCPPPSNSLSHAKLMSVPWHDRAKLLSETRMSQKTVEGEDDPRIPYQWSLPKEERQGSDSSDLIENELSPLEFSRLLIGGRGGS